MSFYSNFLTMCNNIGKTPSKVVTEVGLKSPLLQGGKLGETLQTQRLKKSLTTSAYLYWS